MDRETIKALVINNLRCILEDTTAPASARSSAGRTLAEIAGLVGQAAAKQRQGIGQPLENLDKSALLARLAELSSEQEDD